MEVASPSKLVLVLVLVLKWLELLKQRGFVNTITVTLVGIFSERVKFFDKIEGIGFKDVRNAELIQAKSMRKIGKYVFLLD